MHSFGNQIAGFFSQMADRQYDLASVGVAECAPPHLQNGKNTSSPASNFAALSASLPSEFDHVGRAVACVDEASEVAAKTQLAIERIEVQLQNLLEIFRSDGDTHAGHAEAESMCRAEAIVDELKQLLSIEVAGRGIFDCSNGVQHFGCNPDQISTLRVDQVQCTDATISGSLSRKASPALLKYRGGNSAVKDEARFLLRGTAGAVTVEVHQNQALDEIAGKVNATSQQTGVAARARGNSLVFSSNTKGPEAFVAVKILEGHFPLCGNENKNDRLANDSDIHWRTDPPETVLGRMVPGGFTHRALGRSGLAVINGKTIQSDPARANLFRYEQDSLHFELEFAEGFAGTFDPVTISDNLPYDLPSRANRPAFFIHAAISLHELVENLESLLAPSDNHPLSMQEKSAACGRILQTLAHLGRAREKAAKFAEWTIEASRDVRKKANTVLRHSLDGIRECGLDAERILLMARPASDERPSLLWKAFESDRENTDLRNALIEQYMPLVEDIARKTARRLPDHIDHETLHSAGVLGLIDAVQRFESSRGLDFPGFAKHRIRGAMLDELRRLDTIPRESRRLTNVRQDVEDRFYSENGRLPTEEEILAMLDWDEEALRRSRPNEDLSLDQVAYHDASGEKVFVEDLLADTRNQPASRVELQKTFDQMTRGLEFFERMAIYLRYWRDMPIKEIGDTLGVTESRISQTISQALAHLGESILQRMEQ